MAQPQIQHRRPPRKSAQPECCTESGCESGLRNNFFKGKSLTAAALSREQRHHIERRRLLNRAIHGWGVVYGFAVAVAPEKSAAGQLVIGAGLALDALGRELLTGETRLRFQDVLVLDENGGMRGGNWLLSAHYAEQSFDRVTVEDACSCRHEEWDSVCETVRYTLRRVEDEECCLEFHCELECRCATGRCCEAAKAPDPQRAEHEKQVTHEPRPPCRPFGRGGCRCLCEHLTGLKVGGEEGHLCEIEDECAHVRVDLRNGVPLACVELVPGECDALAFGRDVEACGPRRLVKRNDLLFDLIRGCDLTRISAVGWADWHRSDFVVPYRAFHESFVTEDSPPDAPSGRYWVEFSREVRADSLRPDCFAMTILIQEQPEAWLEVRRVPVEHVRTWPPKADLVKKVEFIVDPVWLNDAVAPVEARLSTCFDVCPAWVEIEVFGDYIVDCNGQSVDANVRGLCGVPSGNGAPGGTLRSSFRVAPRRRRQWVAPDELQGDVS